MTKTYAKYGLHHFTYQNFPDIVDGFSAHDRISRAVAQEQTIIVIYVELVIPRDKINSCSSFNKTTKLVIFEATIYSTDSWVTIRIIGPRSLQLESILQLILDWIS